MKPTPWWWVILRFLLACAVGGLIGWAFATFVLGLPG